MKNPKKSLEVATTEKKDVYQMVTDFIINKLEAGVIAWRKPWKAVPGQPGTSPCNYITKEPYKGINAFMLFTMPYEKQYYMTCKQANDLGGKVKKGEKGQFVVFWTFLYYDKEGNKVTNPKDAFKKVPLLRYYTVFNVEQIEGIEYKYPVPVISVFNEIEACETIVANMPNKPSIDNRGGDRAYYTPTFDRISMPAKKAFKVEAEYYCTLFHEMIHSTGHAKRLNREELVNHDGFGGTNYSKEELTAELGAAFLCATAGIETATIDNSAAYIHSWIKAFKDDKTMLVKAAGKAQKASDYILNKAQVFEQVA